MRLLSWGFVIFFTLISTTAFSPPVEENANPKRLIALDSDVFSRYTSQVYHQLSFDRDTLDYEVLHKALKGYTYLKATNQLENPRFLSIIDFTKYCNDKRLWVVDLQERRIVHNELVAHGRRSGSSFANTFSNQHRSNKSSLGFYITGGTYYGRNGLSLKLNGIERRFNSNAFSRGIVIHGANYVSDHFVQRDERIGRSFGCPAVDARVNKQLVNTLKGGSCLFIYHSNGYYQSNSHLFNAELYLPLDELK